MSERPMKTFELRARTQFEQVQFRGALSDRAEKLRVRPDWMNDRSYEIACACAEKFEALVRELEEHDEELERILTNE